MDGHSTVSPHRCLQRMSEGRHLVIEQPHMWSHRSIHLTMGILRVHIQDSIQDHTLDLTHIPHIHIIRIIHYIVLRLLLLMGCNHMRWHNTGYRRIVHSLRCPTLEAGTAVRVIPNTIEAHILRSSRTLLEDPTGMMVMPE